MDDTQVAADTNTASGEEQVQEQATEEVAEQVQSILGAKPKEETLSYKPADFLEVAKQFSIAEDGEELKAFAELMSGAGVKDAAASNNLLSLHMQEINMLADYYKGLPEARKKQDFEETVKHYGGTVDNPGEKFNAAVAKVGIALQAIEKHVPGIRASLAKGAVDNDINFIRAFELVGELVGEDGNLMRGGAAVSAEDFYPNTDFSKI